MIKKPTTQFHSTPLLLLQFFFLLANIATTSTVLAPIHCNTLPLTYIYLALYVYLFLFLAGIQFIKLVFLRFSENILPVYLFSLISSTTNSKCLWEKTPDRLPPPKFSFEEWGGWKLVEFSVGFWFSFFYERRLSSSWEEVVERSFCLVPDDN